MAAARSSPQVISPESFAASLSNRQLHCRELGHNWKPLTASYDQKARAYTRTLRCPSCHTHRVQLLDSSGHVLSNHYRYPKGYLAANVERGGTGLRDLYRLESLSRFLSQPNLTAVS